MVMILKNLLVISTIVLLYAIKSSVSDNDQIQCSAVFRIPGIASEPGQTLCQLAENCTSCCSYNTSCCGFLGCCNGTCCDGMCCDKNVGTCQKLATSDNYVCVPLGHNLCGDTICDLNYDCCGSLCAPDGSDCCDDGSNPRFCPPSTLCCANGCCDDSSPVCCPDYQSCCTSDSPTCCPTVCCGDGYYCCADSCCPDGSDHCGDGYYCDPGKHCCGTGSAAWCCDSDIDCCNSGCCSKTSPRCCDSLCWLDGWQPCYDLVAEIDGVPRIPTEAERSSYCKEATNAGFIRAVTDNSNFKYNNKPYVKSKVHRATSIWQKNYDTSDHHHLSWQAQKSSIKLQSKDSVNCLDNPTTSVDPCFGFPCFMQITDCKDENGYLNFFGEGMLCKNEAESSLFDDAGKRWFNCSQLCITSEIQSTVNNVLVPCCNSLQEYGLKYINPKCFVAECNFCSIYQNNFVALEEIFSGNIENVYWQQILDFMNDCKKHTSVPTTTVPITSLKSSTTQNPSSTRTHKEETTGTTLAQSTTSSNAISSSYKISTSTVTQNTESTSTQDSLITTQVNEKTTPEEKSLTSKSYTSIFRSSKAMKTTAASAFITAVTSEPQTSSPDTNKP